MCEFCELIASSSHWLQHDTAKSYRFYGKGIIAQMGSVCSGFSRFLFGWVVGGIDCHRAAWLHLSQALNGHDLLLLSRHSTKGALSVDFIVSHGYSSSP